MRYKDSVYFCDCWHCRTERNPIAKAREYRGTAAVKRPVLERNPDPLRVPDPDDISEFSIVTARP